MLFVGFLFRTKYFMSLRGIANGDAVAISRKGSILQNPRKILSYLRGEKSHTSKSAVRAARKGNRVKNALTVYVKFIIKQTE